MENSKLLRKTLNKTTTRTIGINTDMNIPSLKCIKCLQDTNTCQKLGFLPYFLPFHYPFCNCMIFAHFQNNYLSDSLNSCCKCNPCNGFTSFHSLQNSTSGTSCKNCISRTCCEELKNSQQKNEVLSEMRNDLKRQNSETVCCDGKKQSDIMNDISSCDITKYANDFLENNYRSKYGSKTKQECELYKEDEENNIKSNINEKHLLNHLLTPNTKRTDRTKVENEEESDCVESETEEHFSEDEDVPNKTALLDSQIEYDETAKNLIVDKDKTVQNEIEMRRPQRINLNNQNSSKKQTEFKNRDVNMLMMIKALVNEQYDGNNTSRLNKLLTHIGSATEMPENDKNTVCTTPRRRNKGYNNLMSKLNENKN